MLNTRGDHIDEPQHLQFERLIPDGMLVTIVVDHRSVIMQR